ncbi:MAG TPA: twin-arginine translocase subunit TatC [Anaerolineaceae bacterium]|nr:twin-arginine translocase subunit TatC [Anaerolineaceae bacterium]
MSRAANELTFLGHIEELRRRLLIAVGALIAATLVGLALTPQLVELLARPIGGTQNLQAIQVTENIAVFMRISLLGGVILASPVILYEILAFLSPALEKNEKRILAVGIPAATLLFLGGVAFTYFVMLPVAVPALFSTLDVPTTPTASNYFGFITNMLFWMGVGFETPIVVFLLARLQIITPKMLLKNWRIATVVVAILAGVITPTVDPVNMALLMAPLLLLYWISVLLAFLAMRKPKARQTEGRKKANNS